MKKILLTALASSFVLMSCEGGLTYSSCQITTTSDVINSLNLEGACVDIDGGGFLLSADAEEACKDKFIDSDGAFAGAIRDSLIAEPQRASCPTEEE